VVYLGYRLIIKGSVSKPTKDLTQVESKKDANSKLMEASTGVTYIAYDSAKRNSL
jgi:hypothetical protein